MLKWYEEQVEILKKKVIAHGKLGNELKVSKLNKEIANYEKFISQNTSKGVDKYLN